MFSRFTTVIFPRSKHLLNSWLQSPSAVILEPPPNKVFHCFHCSPSICHEVMGPDAMILVFRMLSLSKLFPSLSFSSRGSLVLPFWTVVPTVLEKTLESPLACKEIQPVHPKGNQSWTFIGRTNAEVETPILWLPDVKNWLIWKDPDAGKYWKQEEKGTIEAEMVGCHHQLFGHEFQ